MANEQYFNGLRQAYIRNYIYKTRQICMHKQVGAAGHMQIKWYHYLLAIIGIAIVGTAIFIYLGQQPAAATDHDTLYQVSTIGALMQGDFDGVMNESELQRHGDMGIGTIDGLDGEMIAVDGTYYQIKSDGIAYQVNGSMTVPFAAVTFFETDRTLHVGNANNMTALTGQIDRGLPSKNYFYAFHIDRTFPYVKTRSIPKQEKPYSNLTVAAAGQSVFEFHNVTGSIVGFYTPSYASGVNVPGYHLHFITQDRKAGGHVLDVAVDNASVQLDLTPDFYMELPENENFAGTDLTGDQQQALEKVEK
jgi:acetolactate decarboxylase